MSALFMRKTIELINFRTYDTIIQEVKMKLSRADIQIIELKDKVKLSITKSSSEYLKEVLKKNKPIRTVRKVKI